MSSLGRQARPPNCAVSIHPAGGPSYVSSRTLCRTLKSKDQVPLPISGVVHLVQCYRVPKRSRGHPFKPAALYNVPVAMFACNAPPVSPMPKIAHRSPKPVTPRVAVTPPTSASDCILAFDDEEAVELKLSFVKSSALNVGHVPPSFLDPHAQNMPGRFDVFVLASVVVGPPPCTLPPPWLPLPPPPPATASSSTKSKTAGSKKTEPHATYTTLRNLYLAVYALDMGGLTAEFSEWWKAFEQEKPPSVLFQAWPALLPAYNKYSKELKKASIPWLSLEDMRKHINKVMGTSTAV
ncbi:hypothetical protein DFH08DRAFT_963566 [Mycena albidolilacea]|uniref:Uncharacterized protein n=1 Tax=Mycena albidolilacea TaxID=1033008 RepID=A0AAD6ZV11_9AGAR|nr:hypothetical protein DFH08DRAFT_963566 [Mycena albidolilacea]